MIRKRCSLKKLLFLTIGLASLFSANATLEQSVDELAAILQVSAAGQPPTEMNFFVDPERIRLDASDEVSVIWEGGASSRIMLVQHPQQQYIELGGQQLQMMQQMMQQMQNQSSGAGTQSSVLDPAEFTFETTSNIDQVGGWNATEVLMTGPDGEQASLWFSTDSETGLFELMARVSEATQALQIPMVGGGIGAAQQFLQYETIAEAQGLPDGYVVKIVSQGPNAATMTLEEINPGPLPAGTFDAPNEYRQMQLPIVPGAPGQD